MKRNNEETVISLCNELAAASGARGQTEAGFADLQAEFPTLNDQGTVFVAERDQLRQTLAELQVRLTGVQAERKRNEETVASLHDELAEANEARGLLKQLAGQLRPAISACRLEITGHTDQEPVRSGIVPDNQALGYDRALAVVEYFTTECSLPVYAFSVVSAGEVNPPYPNTSPELSRKNRTVTILVVPR